MKRNKTEIAIDLVEKLWENFVNRVPYARTYRELVTRFGGQIVIDHIGFRTLNANTGEQPDGILGIRHIFELLGYKISGKYYFPGKKLKAVYFEPESKVLPKIFISQLEVKLLPLWAQQLINESTSETPYLLTDNGITLLNKLNFDGFLTNEAADLLVAELVHYFRRPWTPPFKNTILKLNDISHYASWTLLHGNAPSHFASLINRQNVPGWSDISATCQALQLAGIPVKSRIEGRTDNLLQQSATLASREFVPVKEDGIYQEIPWTYGYIEYIQRNQDNMDQSALFQGFIEEHERHLYKMTVTLEN